MKRSLFALAAVFALVIAAPAGAKEIAKVKVCGTSGCHETSDKHKLAGLSDGGTNAGPPKSGSPFYKITLSVRAGKARDHFTIAYLPAQKLIKGEGPDPSAQWVSVDDTAAAFYTSLIGDLRPFPASQLGKINPAPGARVDSVVTPPAPIPAVDDGSFPWLIVVLGGAGVLSLAGATAGRRRLRARRAASSPAPHPAQ
ncbi:MAG: hypothetical protein QOI98_1904 [Solirubrobacteraceae bacterium]|jgi:hypothetical protein|nr:hypothetical protein [Solirubrobacteraceae bacterium]